MTQFAQFDHAAAPPAAVLGWYDTGLNNYPNMPASADLLALTPEQWAARVSGRWAVQGGELVPYAPPPPLLTLAQQAQEALAAGFAVRSTGAPAINGTYRCDERIQHKIVGVCLYIQINGKFPGGAATFPWVDTSGAPHVFPNTTAFQTFATALADYVAALEAIVLLGTGTLPVQPVTIP